MKELQQRQESGRAERHKKKMAGVERRRRVCFLYAHLLTGRI